MANKIIRIISVTCVALAALSGILYLVFIYTPRYYDLKTDHRDLVKHNDTVDFTAAAWSTADQKKRGQMLASLFRKHRFVGQDTDFVRDLLGESTDYCVQDGHPCYKIQYGRLYRLYFRPVYSKGNGSFIKSVSLYEK